MPQICVDAQSPPTENAPSSLPSSLPPLTKPRMCSFVNHLKAWQMRSASFQRVAPPNTTSWKRVAAFAASPAGPSEIPGDQERKERRWEIKVKTVCAAHDYRLTLGRWQGWRSRNQLRTVAVVQQLERMFHWNPKNKRSLVRNANPARAFWAQRRNYWGFQSCDGPSSNLFTAFPRGGREANNSSRLLSEIIVTSSL